MSRRNPPAKWVLPNVVDPPTSTCWVVPVPDDPFHKAAFLGALAALGSAYKWQDDPDHTAKQVADVWRRIADDLEKCQPIPQPKIYSEAEMTKFRTDCNCNVYIECCDGSEKQILTAQQVKDLIGGSSPGPVPQPPAGGCETYSGNVTGLGTWPIPAPVSENDTIELSGWQGSSNGDNLTRWNCGNGDQFFAGTCSDYPHIDSGTRVPSIPIGSMVVKIESTWYDARSILTVPAGISNAQAIVGLNYNESQAANGTLTFNVEVCNNATVEWCYTTDFSTSTGSFVACGDCGLTNGAWSAGSGWVNTDGADTGGDWWRGVDIERVFAATTITHLDMLYDVAGSGYGTFVPVVAEVRVRDGSGTQHQTDLSSTTITDGDHQLLTLDGSFAGIVKINLDLHSSWQTTSGALVGSVLIRRMTVRGTGTNPFGSSNC